MHTYVIYTYRFRLLAHVCLAQWNIPKLVAEVCKHSKKHVQPSKKHWNKNVNNPAKHLHTLGIPTLLYELKRLKGPF